MECMAAWFVKQYHFHLGKIRQVPVHFSFLLSEDSLCIHSEQPDKTLIGFQTD
jgi:hypothetical protein